MRFFAMWHYSVALTTPSPMLSEHSSKILSLRQGARPTLTYLTSKSESELFYRNGFFVFMRVPLSHYMQVGTAAKRRQTLLGIVCYTLPKKTRMRGVGSHFQHCFFYLRRLNTKNEENPNGNEAKNEMQHAALCNNMHMLRFNKNAPLRP
jgi:hypothetical protein